MRSKLFILFLILSLIIPPVCFSAPTTEFTMGVGKHIIAGSRSLSDNVVTPIFVVALPTGNGFGCIIDYIILVSAGTEYQTHMGRAIFAAVHNGGYHTDIVHVVSQEAEARTSSSLTDTWSITTGVNQVTVSLNANTGLTTPIIVVRYFIYLGDPNVITLQP